MQTIKAMMKAAYEAMDTFADTMGTGGHEPQRAASRDVSCAWNIVFEFTTPNGFRITSRRGEGLHVCGNTLYTFLVQSPKRQTRAISVCIPVYVHELIRAHTGRENMPGGTRFLHAYAEEVLCNALMETGDFPENGQIDVTEFSPAMVAWVDTLKGGD